MLLLLLLFWVLLLCVLLLIWRRGGHSLDPLTALHFHYPPLFPYQGHGHGYVPLMIHQTLSNREVPTLLWERLLQPHRKTAPHFSFSFYDDNEMEAVIRQHFPPRVLAAYHRIHPAYGACRSDFGRYCILYVYGGLYLDIKSEIRKDPLPWLSSKNPVLLGGHWKHAAYHAELLNHPKGEVMNWVLASTPHHPLLWELIMDITQRIETGPNGRGKQFVLELTGPIALSRIALGKMDISDKIHEYFKYNSERCGWTDCKTVYYQGKKSYDQLVDEVLLSTP